MHGINKRQQKFLKLLIESKDFKPVKDYADLLGVSTRTLYKDLDNFEDILPEETAELERLPRKGILLKTNRSLADFFSQSEFSSQQVGQSPFLRQISIAHDLLVKDRTVTYQELADRFLVSKTSIANDLEQIQSMTKNSQIQIRSDQQGTKVVGDESDRQKAIKDYAYFIMDQTEDSSDFRMQFSKEVRYFLQEKGIIRQLLEIFKNDHNTTIHHLSDNYFQSLLLSLSIFLIRLQQGKHIESKNYLMLESIELLTTYFLTENLAEKIGAIGQVEINKADFDYLNKQLISHGLEPNLEDLDAKENYQQVVASIIREMSYSLKVDLTSDEKLRKNILYHLLTMIYRLKLNMPIKNPLLKEIRDNYSILYSTTWLVLSKYEPELGIQFTDDEIAFLAVHFQGAVDRLSKKRYILVVCPTGIGTSELIANRLRSLLFPHDMLEVVSLRSLYNSDLSKVDLIISSVHLKELEVPVVQVSPLMNKEDLKKVVSVYLDLFYEDEEKTEDIHFHELSSVLDKRLIFLEEDFSSKKECIEKLSDELLAAKVVTPDFLNAIWNREKMGVTDLPTGVAIPHAPADVVSESKLAIMTLKKPIRWHLRMVNTILMICIAEKDFPKVKEILSDIYKIVESEKKVKNLFFFKTKEEIYQELGGKELD